MSRTKKYKEGTCPQCKSYGVRKKEEKNVTNYTCNDCGFMYTIRSAPPRPDSDPGEKEEQLWDEEY